MHRPHLWWLQFMGGEVKASSHAWQTRSLNNDDGRPGNSSARWQAPASPEVAMVQGRWGWGSRQLTTESSPFSHCCSLPSCLLQM